MHVLRLVGFVICLAVPLAAAAQVMPTPVWMAKESTAPLRTTASGVLETTASAAPAQTPKPGDPATSPSVAATLSPEDVQKILSNAEGASSRTVSYTGMRSTTETKRACRHHIFVVDRQGKVIGRRSMPDAWLGSIDIALGKARTAAYFSSDENALSSRQIGQLSQAHGPDGTGPAGPLWGIGHTNRGTGETAQEVPQNTLVTFPGGLPLYKGGKLVGGIGVSGDGVDQDESVAFGGAQGFQPPPSVGSPTPIKPPAVDWFPTR